MRQHKPPAFTAISNYRKQKPCLQNVFITTVIQLYSSPDIANWKSWQTHQRKRKYTVDPDLENKQINDETGNPCICVFFQQVLIRNLTSLYHLKDFFPLNNVVVLKTKIICLSGCPPLGYVAKCIQDWRLGGWWLRRDVMLGTKTQALFTLPPNSLTLGCAEESAG